MGRSLIFSCMLVGLGKRREFCQFPLHDEGVISTVIKNGLLEVGKRANFHERCSGWEWASFFQR